MLPEEIINQLGPIFDTHEHFGVFSPSYSLNKTTTNLKSIIDGAYLQSGTIKSTDYVTIASNLKKQAGSDGFESLRAGLAEMYGIDLYPITESKLKDLDARIQDAYQNPYHILKSLQNYGIKKVVLDIPPPLWSNWDHPIIGTTIRQDHIIFPFISHPSGYFLPSFNTNHSDWNPETNNALKIESLDEFEEFLEDQYNKLNERAIAVKIGVAYNRPIDFKLEENDDGKINELFARLKEKNVKFTQNEMIRWGNYIVTHLLGFANFKHLPVQIHTGLAYLEGSNPINLAPIMRAFPGVNFCLFHGGYPFHDQLAGLLYSVPNAYADLCWMPILNHKAAKSLLSDLISVKAGFRTFAYGGDTQTLEGSIGALITIKKILAKVLSRKIEEGKLIKEDAIELGNAMLYDNAANLFGIK